jgi:hypothetical protein
MSSYGYSSNDDDLFDYDPDEETSLFSSTFQPKEDSFISKVKENAEDIEQFAQDNKLIYDSKASFAMAFYEATEHYIYSSISEANLKSINITLDNLTSGNHSLSTMFYRLELKISRRMHFLSIFETLFSHDDLSESFTEKFYDIFKIKITPFYLKTCYHSSLAICTHALALDRATYRHLSKKLNIPVKQFLFDSPTQMTVQNHKLEIQDYEQIVNTNIIKAIANDGLIQEIAEEFSITPTFVNTNEN